MRAALVARGVAVAALVVCVGVAPSTSEPRLLRVLGVVLAMAVLWIAEALPAAVVALLPVPLFPLLGVASSDVVCQEYMTDAIMLFLASCLLSIAFEQTGLHLRVAYSALALVGASPTRLLLAIVGTTALASCVMSASSTALMMTPIVRSVIEAIEVEDAVDAPIVRKLGAGMMLAVAYATSIGGAATLTGSGVTVVLNGLWPELYPDRSALSYGQWVVFALPCQALLLLVTATVLYFRYCPRGLQARLLYMHAESIADRRQRLGPMSGDERVVAMGFLLTFLLWLLRNPGFMPGWGAAFSDGMVSDATPALLVSAVFFSMGLYDGRKVLKDGLPWDVFVLVGGGFALARGLREAELDAWIAERLSRELASLTLVEQQLVVAAAMSGVTEFLAQSSAGALFLPIAARLAEELSLHPLATLIPATLAGALAFSLPISTPPNAIVYGTGYLTFWDFAVTGLPLNVAGIAVSALIAAPWGAVVFGFEPRE